MANHVIIPKDYRPALNIYNTQQGIDCVKQLFQQKFCKALNLKRVSAPIFVQCDMGLNDNLRGVERPVMFDVPAVGANAEIVHSLAKWKRLALKRYNFTLHEGLLTDMNAIRRDEDLDNIHSIYVDQWDWEIIIERQDRTVEYLQSVVRKIVEVIYNVNCTLGERFPNLKKTIKKEVTFITSQELEDLYPDLTPEQREAAFAKEHKTIFVMQIGCKLKSGISHGDRSPDYDDWSLNGDLIFWNDILEIPFEISSMGVRVDKEALERQLAIAGCEERKSLYFHNLLLNDQLPLTIGGGIGQSRLCMLLLQCAHIGEVQSSVWDEETMKACAESGIILL